MAAMNPTPYMPTRFWSDLTTAQFEGRRRCGLAARTVAVLPVAATEQHGPHLPLNVDSTLADAMVRAALPHLDAQAQVLFLPTQTVCLSNEHAAFAGTLTLRPETVLRVWTELGECVQRAGVNRLVLFNSHGGNVSLMDLVARDLRARLGMMVWHASWFNLPLGDDVMGLFPPQEHRFGIHGGDIETSLMLAIRPDLVDMGQARHFQSASEVRAATCAILGNGRSAKLGWQMQDYNPAGAVGDASAATAEKGQALLQAVGAQLAALLHEVQALPDSTLCEKNI
jgi:creatinine amidohydrolase